jgi:hypothetical protein
VSSPVSSPTAIDELVTQIVSSDPPSDDDARRLARHAASLLTDDRTKNVDRCSDPRRSDGMPQAPSARSMFA